MTIDVSKINYGTVVGVDGLAVTKINYSAVVGTQGLDTAKINFGVVVAPFTGRRRELINT